MKSFCLADKKFACRLGCYIGFVYIVLYTRLCM